MEGVLSILTAKDIPGNNLWGDVVQDEEFLADKEVVYYGININFMEFNIIFMEFNINFMEFNINFMEFNI